MDKHRLFISYSRIDTEPCNIIVDGLMAAGISCWIDREGIEAGLAWAKIIGSAINDSDVVLLLASEHSLKSDNVFNEIGLAIAKKKRIIPVLLDDLPPTYPLEYHIHSLNFLSCPRTSIVENLGTLVERIQRALGMESKLAQASGESINRFNQSEGLSVRDCEKCGEMNPPAAKFCKGCGKPFKVSNNASPEITTPEVETLREMNTSSATSLCVPDQFNEILCRVREHIPGISHQAKAEYITIHVGNDRDKTLRLKPKADGFWLEWTTPKSDDWEHRFRTVGIGIEYKTSINKGAYVIKVKGGVSQSTTQLLVEFLRSVFGRHVDSS
jgi:hypothetical protein